MSTAVHSHQSTQLRKEVACHRASGPQVCSIRGMNTPLVPLLQRERAAGFSGLAGTHVDATVPLTQRLVDLLVAQAGAARNLGGLKVTLGADNQIGVAVVKSVFGFNTRLAIDLRIRGPVDLVSDPRLYLLVARPSITWSAISRIVIAASLAPPGVEIARDGVAIDLRMLAARAGFADVLALVQKVAFDGDAGALRVRAVIDVPQGGISPEARQAPQEAGAPGPSSGAGMRKLPSADALVTELRGARLSGRVSVSEALANEAIRIALEAARAAGSGESTGSASGVPPAVSTGLRLDAGMLAGWVRQAGVRFQNGRIVLEPDILIG